MNRSPQSPTLQVSLLGDFRLIHDEQLVTSVNTPRLQSLLTYLVLHRGAPQSRHHLAFTFWPDSTEAQALTNLRNLLYHLRRALPDADDFLHIDGQTVQWRTGTSFALVDVAEFEGALARGERSQQDGDKAGLQSSLEEAAVLYRGDLLPSCYADWILPERERLRSSFVRTLERLVLLLEDEREYQSAISYAERLLRHDPLHEATYRRLMRLHALMRDRAGALRVYHTCTTVLQRELAVDPSPATREMYDRLLNADRPLGHGTPPATPIGPAAALQLIGRQHEWLRLREAWQTTSTGRSHFALVAGEAGIGKTRLVEELIQWAGRQGITTAATRCYAAEGVLAYGPVVSWLRSHPLPPLEPVWRSELTRILPELLVQDPDISPPGPLTEGWQRQRFFEALARAILPPTQPLLLSIDDLHWCDRETLEWLHYLLRSAPKAQLLVVGTLRPEETDENHPLPAIVDRD